MRDPKTRVLPLDDAPSATRRQEMHLDETPRNSSPQPSAGSFGFTVAAEQPEDARPAAAQERPFRPGGGQRLPHVSELGGQGKCRRLEIVEEQLRETPQVSPLPTREEDGKFPGPSCQCRRPQPLIDGSGR